MSLVSFIRMHLLSPLSPLCVSCEEQLHPAVDHVRTALWNTEMPPGCSRLGSHQQVQKQRPLDASDPLTVSEALMFSNHTERLHGSAHLVEDSRGHLSSKVTAGGAVVLHCHPVALEEHTVMAAGTGGLHLEAQCACVKHKSSVALLQGCCATFDLQGSAEGHEAHAQHHRPRGVTPVPSCALIGRSPPRPRLPWSPSLRAAASCFSRSSPTRKTLR